MLRLLALLLFLHTGHGYAADADGSVEAPKVSLKPGGLTAACAAKGSWSGPPPEDQARQVCLDYLSTCIKQAEYSCSENSSASDSSDPRYTFSCSGSTLKGRNGKPSGFIEIRTGEPPKTTYHAACFANCTCTYPATTPTGESMEVSP